MGRRSSHTPDELRELILDVATDIVSRDGLRNLSAREIARRVGYSPGTIYNVFADIDDLVLTIEYRMLDQLVSTLDAVPRPADPAAHVLALSKAYLAFALERPHLWNLLNEHAMPPAWKAPPLLGALLAGTQGVFTRAMEPLLQADDAATGADVRSAAVWSSVHGIASLAVGGKLAGITRPRAAEMIEHIVSTYLAGLKCKTPAAAAAKRRRPA